MPILSYLHRPGLVFILLLIIVRPVWAQPTAVFPESEFIFGTAAEGQIIQHDFAVINQGSSSLRILSARPTCSCTRVEFDHNPIAPGQQARIRVNLNTEGYGGQKAQVRISVLTDDLAAGETNLVLSGTVDKLFSMQPSVVRLEGAAGQVLRKTVVITPEPRYHLSILEARAQKGENLFFTLEEDHENLKRIYRLTVELSKETRGLYFDKILLTTNNPARPEIRIAVFAKITG